MKNFLRAELRANRTWLIGLLAGGLVVWWSGI